MTIVNHRAIFDHITKCYIEYDPTWPADAMYRTKSKPEFKSYLEQLAGLKIKISARLDFSKLVRGNSGFDLYSIKVVDYKKYTMFLLRYSA
jgi:hypothetical protein